MFEQYENSTSKKIVALCCSTGGPRALLEVVPKLPADLPVPFLIVQHMALGFTKALAERLDALSKVPVYEATEGMELKPGNVYLARAGMHMVISTVRHKHFVNYTDDPPREGVKPCANYMYESLAESDYEHITCVVLTGMGSDGTEGIKHLMEKKDVSIIVQDEESCVVFGMPGSIVRNNFPCKVVNLGEITKTIVKDMEE